jgi:hypothetical protein
MILIFLIKNRTNKLNFDQLNVQQKVQIARNWRSPIGRSNTSLKWLFQWLQHLLRKAPQSNSI